MYHHLHLIFSHDCMVPHGTPTGNQLFTKACLLDTLWWHCAEQNTFKPYKSYLLPWAVENWKKGVVVKSSYYKISDLKNMIILCIFWINSFLMPLIPLVDFFISKSTWFSCKESKINWSWISNLYMSIARKNCKLLQDIGIFIIGKLWLVWNTCSVILRKSIRDLPLI